MAFTSFTDPPSFVRTYIFLSALFECEEEVGNHVISIYVLYIFRADMYRQTLTWLMHTAMRQGRKEGRKGEKDMQREGEARVAKTVHKIYR